MGAALPRARRFVDPVAVPRLWPDSMIVCIATGPSLTRADCDYVQGKAHAIAVNDAGLPAWAPWADVLYACDKKWWFWKRGAPTFTGLKFTLQREATCWPGVQLLAQTGKTGLETNPTGLKTGMNSGYQAINLAVHLGARRIVLLGYDMRGDHCFGHHPDHSKPPFGQCIPAFRTLVKPLAALGIEVVNCTRKTNLDAFPCRRLEEVL